MYDLRELMKCEIVEVREDIQPPNLYGKFLIEPLEAGWGITIGNALRRVLLSSIEGSAVTAVQIEGVMHEFSVLPGVREDVSDIILNLKGLVLKSHSKEEILYLDVKGEPGHIKVVTGADIQKNSNVEIINPDHYIAEVNEEGHLVARIYVARGKGYQEADETKYRELDIIPVDSVFTPVKKVNYQVLDTRVGQFTNYDKLVVEIWTNGAITPQEAMERALELLRDNFSYLLELLRERIGETGVKADTSEETLEEFEEEVPIEDIDLSVRAINCLKRAKINTLRELLEVVRNRPEDLKKIKNLGQKTYEEILEKVQQRFLSSSNAEKRGVGE